MHQKVKTRSVTVVGLAFEETVTPDKYNNVKPFLMLSACYLKNGPYGLS